MRKTFLKRIACVTLVLAMLVLPACKKDDEEKTETSTEPIVQDSVQDVTASGFAIGDFQIVRSDNAKSERGRSCFV